MIQFIIHILSAVFTAFLIGFTAFLIGFMLVWIQRKFSKESQYKFTYEFRVFTLKAVSPYSDEDRLYQARLKLDELNKLGAEGWEIVGIGSDTCSGKEIFLQRATTHKS